MIKPLVVTAAFYDRDYDEKLYRLLATAQMHNIEVHPYGKGEFFDFFKSKIPALREFIEQFRGQYAHVLYTDAADSFFLAGLDEIMYRYDRMGAPSLLVSGEKGCHPYAYMKKYFDSKYSTPWRYMNPGGFLGHIDWVLRALEAIERYADPNTNDQGPWMKALDDRAILVKVDQDCDIFQTMSDHVEGELDTDSNGRLRNTITGATPCIVHFNGPKSDAQRGLAEILFTYSKEIHDVLPSWNIAGL